MKPLWHIIAAVMLISVPFAGCGGGGAPGSTNSVQTDVVIRAASLSIETPDIDVNIHACPPDFTTVEPGLFRADAVLNIDAERLNNTIDYDPFPASVESCTVTYLKANEDPASPVIEQMTIYPNCPLVDGVLSCPVTLMDIQRKVTWWNMVAVRGANAPAEGPTHYIARMQCTYVTRYGKVGTFQTELDIWLADFDLC